MRGGEGGGGPTRKRRPWQTETALFGAAGRDIPASGRVANPVQLQPMQHPNPILGTRANCSYGKLGPPLPLETPPHIVTVTPKGRGGGVRLHHTMVALTLQQFQYPPPLYTIITVPTPTVAWTRAWLARNTYN